MTNSPARRKSEKAGSKLVGALGRTALSLLLAGFYLMLVDSTQPGDLLVAALIGAVIAFSAIAPESDGFRLARLPWLPWFLVGVAGQLVQGAVQVLLILSGFGDWRRVGVVDVPIGSRSKLGAQVSALVFTASPGTVLLDIDWRRGVFVVSAIDAREPEKIRAQMTRFYDRYQRRFLP